MDEQNPEIAAFKAKVAELESRCRAAGSRIGPALTAAQIGRSAWHEWKRGACLPNMAKWLKLVEAVEAIEAKGRAK